MQSAVMARGPLTDSANPSSALMVRIKQAYSSGGGNMMGMGNMGMGGGDVETFIMQSNVDERAANAFRGLSPEAQAAVMARGPIAVSFNPSSALMARIRDSSRVSPY